MTRYKVIYGDVSKRVQESSREGEINQDSN